MSNKCFLSKNQNTHPNIVLSPNPIVKIQQALFLITYDLLWSKCDSAKKKGIWYEEFKMKRLALSYYITYSSIPTWQMIIGRIHLVLYLEDHYFLIDLL